MKQVENDGDWFLMCPDKSPGLNDVYGDEFKELYWKYVKEKKYNSRISARKLFKSIMDSQIETGTRIYFLKMLLTINLIRKILVLLNHLICVLRLLNILKKTKRLFVT